MPSNSISDQNSFSKLKKGFWWKLFQTNPLSNIGNNDLSLRQAETKLFTASKLSTACLASASPHCTFPYRFLWLLSCFPFNISTTFASPVFGLSKYVTFKCVYKYLMCSSGSRTLTLKAMRSVSVVIVSASIWDKRSD